MLLAAVMAQGAVFVTAICDPEPDFNLSIQKVCYCVLDDGTYRFWFEITNKNDIPVDYYWTVSTNPVTGSGTIGAGVGPSVTRLQYFYVDVPPNDVPGQLRLYRTCDDDFQQSIGFNPPNFEHCDRCPFPTLLDANITVIADPTGCVYTSPSTAGDYFVVTAYVTDYTLGPLNGADVTFTISSGQDIASFDATDPDVHQVVNTTYTNGIATAHVYHDAGTYDSGDVMVTATVSDNTFAPDYVLTSSDSTTVSFCPVCDTLTLTADDSPLDAHTPSTTLRAVVLDFAGDPMPDGMIVSFSTTVGTISNVTPVTGGEATALLTYDGTTLPIVAVVSATSSCGADDILRVQYLPVYEGDLALTAVPPIASLCVGSTTLYAHFTSETLDVSGRDVIFSVVNSPSGTYDISPNSATTNNDGVAVTTLSNNAAETVQVQASLTIDTETFTSDVLDVVFTPATVASIELLFPDTDPGPVTLDTCQGSPLAITVVVRDCTDAVMGGIPIYFASTAGTISASPVLSDGNGHATAYLTPSGLVEIAHITVSCPCGTNIDFDVSFVPGAPCSIDAYAVPSSIPADGTSIALVYADVYDCCGNPVENGPSVCLEARNRRHVWWHSPYPHTVVA